MVFTIQCNNQQGLFATITRVFKNEQCNIVSMREYNDLAHGLCFVRIETGECNDPALLDAKLRKVLPEGAVIKQEYTPGKKIIVLVTKEYHCLADILIRNQFNTLGASVQCIIGNHSVLEPVCKQFGIPFHHVSHEGKSRKCFEVELLAVMERYEMDYLVLAKFMRILSPAFSEKFPMRIINIHHSFLPAFIGANPYGQAFRRGVKLIGATAHFVTDDLDEGPIITQQTTPVNHVFTAKCMVKAGKEIETAVLAKALSLVLDNKVMVYNNRTVVFD